MVYKKSQQIHFIGIGGIGVSALAKYYLSRGAKISGSDLSSSEITDELIKIGAQIFIGKHSKKNLPKTAGMVIHTAATAKDNPELEEAKRRKLRVQSYAEALGELTKKYKTITVSGAHGKSTTTAMTALVLEKGHCDPLVIVGTKVKEFGNSNFRSGLGGYFVLEADEWNKSFLRYNPQIAVLTNIDAEHLDTYRNIGHVASVFKKFLSRIPKDGLIIANADDKIVKKIAKESKRRVIWYSLKDKEANLIKNTIRVTGDHNILNAIAAFRVGRALGVGQAEILQALSGFSGTWRRFEFKGIINKAPIFDDYAHHPSEIKATLAAAKRRFPFGRVISVFQPHQHKRLNSLFSDFTGAFDHSDITCVLDVYDVAGREDQKSKKAVNSFMLASALSEKGKDARYMYHSQVADFLKNEVRSNDAVIFMGAGDIYKLTNKVVSEA